MRSSDLLPPGCHAASSRPPERPDDPVSSPQPAETSPADVVLTDDLFRADVVAGLNRIAAAVEQIAAAAAEQRVTAIPSLGSNTPADPARQPNLRKKSGRHKGSVRTDLEDDRRIWEAWSSGRYKTHKDLARELHRKVKEIDGALDRERHRRKQSAARTLSIPS